MKSIYRLKKNYQYNYVYKHAESVADKNFVMLYCTNAKQGVKQTRVGFSVSKKFGKAVKRNRIRRQMKAAVSVNMPRVKDGYNVIFIPRRHESYLFEEVLNSVQYLLKKADLLQ
ncbi:MAG: ribonuclease P protein component [Clostridiales bacterium]|nr:ribonuclease P protein component [Clostridiales bacterium]